MKKKRTLDVNFISDGNGAMRKVVVWIAIYGMIFVVLTSAIIIGASAYNLYLDKKVVALDAQISQKLKAINDSSEFENEFLTVQAKLEDYRTTLSNERMEDLLPKLTLVTPAEVTLQEMVIDPTSVTISGSVLTQSALATYINNIMQISNETFEDGSSVEFGNLSVDQISNAGGNQLGYNFAIQFNYMFR